MKYLPLILILLANVGHAQRLGQVTMIKRNEVITVVQKIQSDWALAFDKQNTKLLLELLYRSIDHEALEQPLKDPRSKDPNLKHEIEFSDQKQQIDFVVELRKKAQLVRTAHTFFTRDHKTEQTFAHFLRALGMYKDARIAFAEKKGDPKEALVAIEDSARFLISHIKENEKTIRDSFENSELIGKDSVEAFVKHKTKQLNEHLNHISKANDGKLFLEDERYHEVRKIIRSLNWYLQMTRVYQRGPFATAKSNDTDYNPELLDNIIEEVDKIQKKVMGERHDRIATEFVNSPDTIGKTPVVVTLKALSAIKTILDLYGRNKNAPYLESLMRDVEAYKQLKRMSKELPLVCKKLAG
jgi:hypothetical protein